MEHDTSLWPPLVANNEKRVGQGSYDGEAGLQGGVAERLMYNETFTKADAARRVKSDKKDSDSDSDLIFDGPLKRSMNETEMTHAEATVIAIVAPTPRNVAPAINLLGASHAVDLGPDDSITLKEKEINQGLRESKNMPHNPTLEPGAESRTPPAKVNCRPLDEIETNEPELMNQENEYWQRQSGIRAGEPIYHYNMSFAQPNHYLPPFPYPLRLEPHPGWFQTRASNTCAQNGGVLPDSRQNAPGQRKAVTRLLKSREKPQLSPTGPSTDVQTASSSSTIRSMRSDGLAFSVPVLDNHAALLSRFTSLSQPSWPKSMSVNDLGTETTRMVITSKRFKKRNGSLLVELTHSSGPSPMDASGCRIQWL